MLYVTHVHTLNVNGVRDEDKYISFEGCYKKKDEYYCKIQLFFVH